MAGQQLRRLYPVGEWLCSALLGTGSFASVYKARHRDTGEMAAVKAISLRRLSPRLKEKLESEVAILRSASHQHVVQLKEVLKSTNHLYLILEYCSGGDLSSLPKPMAETEVRRLMRQLSQGLEYLWSRNIVHRDLKPQNLLLDKPLEEGGILKIADFGFARHLAVADMAETLCGSPLYMAPEVLQFESYDAKVDLWSVGVIMYELLVGRAPFSGANHLDLLADITRRGLEFPEDPPMSTVARSLIGMLLRKDPLMRISFQEFFSNRFFQLEAGAAAGAAVDAQLAAGDALPAVPVLLRDAAVEAAGLVHAEGGPGARQREGSSLGALAAAARQALPGLRAAAALLADRWEAIVASI